MHSFSTYATLLLFLANFFCLHTYLVTSSPTPRFSNQALANNDLGLSNSSEVQTEGVISPLHEARLLAKRQCVLSNDKNKNGNFKWKCDGKVISMQEIHDNIQSTGYAAGRTTMFYTKLGGANGVKMSKCWANNHPQWIPPNSNGPDRAGYVMFDRVCDNRWSAAVVQDYNKNKGSLNFDGDQFQKCKSQALAEQASGDVYFFIPRGTDADPGSAWVGWELPALKRNGNVDNVWRVDPSDPNNDDRENIWTKGGDQGPAPKCKPDGTPS